MHDIDVDLRDVQMEAAAQQLTDFATAAEGIHYRGQQSKGLHVTELTFGADGVEDLRFTVELVDSHWDSQNDTIDFDVSTAAVGFGCALPRL